MALNQSTAGLLENAYSSGNINEVNRLLQENQITSGDVQSYWGFTPTQVNGSNINFYSQPSTPSPSVNDQLIRDTVSNIYNNPDMTYEQKAALISSASRLNNVNNADLARATGISINDVNAYLGSNGSGVNTVSPFNSAASRGSPLSGIILAGDSWLSGAENTRNIAEQTGQNVTNVAVGGSTSADTLDQLNRFLSGGGSFDPNATIMLNIGGNDLLQGVDRNTTTSNINQIVSRLGDLGVNVILSGAPSVNSVSDITGSTSLSLNPLYESIQKSNPNVTIVDSMSGLLNQKNIVDSTGFHLTDPGKLAFNASLSNAYLKSQNKDPISYSDDAIRTAVSQSGLDANTAANLAPYFGLTPDRVQSVLSGGASNTSALPSSASVAPSGALPSSLGVNAASTGALSTSIGNISDASSAATPASGMTPSNGMNPSGNMMPAAGQANTQGGLSSMAQAGNATQRNFGGSRMKDESKGFARRAGRNAWSNPNISDD